MSRPPLPLDGLACYKEPMGQTMSQDVRLDYRDRPFRGGGGALP
jgi:hypothetical protein